MTDAYEHVSALAVNPMYQLSTAGQELFHTNMLYWLARHRGTASAPLWHRLGIDAPSSEGPDGPGPIRREWQHVDLYVDSGMGGRKLVLENKVLAVATRKQLEDYRAKLLQNRWIEYADPVTEWRLLTLLPPAFQLPGPWVPVTYADLVPALEETADQLDAADRPLLTTYVDLVRRLVALVQVLDIADDLDAEVALDPMLTEALAEARLLTLVRKLRVSRGASLVNAALSAIDPDLPTVGSALTNTEGLMDFFVPGDRGRSFGWQIQGKQVRLAMLTGDPEPPMIRARNDMAAGHTAYFDFDLPDDLSSLLTPYRGRKDWLGYGHQFVYRYQSLVPGVTWRQVIDLATHLSLRAHEYAHRKGC